MPFLLSFVLLVATQPGNFQNKPVPKVLETKLPALKLVLGQLRSIKSPVMGAIVFDDAITNNNKYNKSMYSSATYDLEKRYNSMVFAIGILDPAEAKTGWCRIDVDGVRVFEEEVIRGAKPIRRVVDLAGRRSLRITLDYGVALAEGFVSSEMPDKFRRSSPALTVPTVAGEPSNASVFIRGDVIKFRWAKVNGASKYVVMIYPTNRLPKESETLVFHTDELPELDLKSSSLAPSTYKWTVLAYGGGKLIGTGTLGKEFTL